MPRKPLVTNPAVVRLGWMLFKVQSSSDPGLYYFVELKDDVWMCDCKGFEKTCIIRSSDCQHIRRVRALYPEVRAATGAIRPVMPVRLDDYLRGMRGWGNTGGRGEGLL